MLSSVVAVVALLALVLPGFIVTELAQSRRASSGPRGALDTILRSLWYSVAIHLIVALAGWTESLYRKLDAPNEWLNHVGAISLYGFVVVVLVPTLLGLSLGRRLRRREQRGQLRWFDYALGGRDARQAWDWVFQHLDGDFVLVYLKSVADPPEGATDADAGSMDAHAPWRTLVGKVGRHSYASQTGAAERDLYLEEVWPADATGRALGDFRPRRGLWVPASEVAALYVIEPDFDAKTPGAVRKVLCRVLSCD